MNPSAALLGVAVGSCAVFALALVVSLNHKSGSLSLWWERHCSKLERRLRGLGIRHRGREVALAQLVAFALSIAGWAATGSPVGMVLAGAALVGPTWVIRRLAMKRRNRLDQQVEGFLTALANALQATPSLGDAFCSLRELLPQPMSSEIEHTEKEVRLGRGFSEALRAMVKRTDSERLGTAVSALLMGRQVGGDLAAVLRSTAVAMREMDRLEGVVRAKTAEGKFQMWALTFIPLVAAFAFELMKPGYFDPLLKTVTGWAALVVAALFWVGALLVARKVLSVEL